MNPLDPEVYRDLVRQALAEDLGGGDITTSAIVPAGIQVRGVLYAKSFCVIAGLDVAASAFSAVDRAIHVEQLVSDGTACESDQELARITGPARALLTAERTALNFLQRLSGIATLTRRCIEAAGGRVRIVDTRKTTPGLRALEKYAVRCGGGGNHRFGLFDAVLIKDNHIRIARGIAEAVRRARAAPECAGKLVEVETQTLMEVDEAIAAGADTIMLDNLSVEDMESAIERIAGRARIEISGGVTLETLPRVARLGADLISIGALTHSAPAADISLEIEHDAGAAS